MAEFERRKAVRGRIPTGSRASPLSGVRRLAVDVEVTSDFVIVRTRLPGQRPEDVSLKISGRFLTIATARPHGWSRRPDQRAIARPSSWYRRLRFSAPVVPDQATVTFNQGELIVRIPRADAGLAILSRLPGGQSLAGTEIPLRSAADVMPIGEGPHVTVYRP